MSIPNVIFTYDSTSQCYEETLVQLVCSYPRQELSLIRTDFTCITAIVGEDVSGHTSTRWKFIITSQGEPDQSFYATTSSAGIEGIKPVNVLYGTLTTIAVALDRAQTWSVCIQTNGVDEWSESAELKQRPRIISNQRSYVSNVTDTTRGATVVNTSTKYTQSFTNTGATVHNLNQICTSGRPIIVWSYNAITDSLENLEIAINRTLITHCEIKHYGRYEIPDVNIPAITDAVDMCRKYNVVPVLIRVLIPLWGTSFDAFNGAYGTTVATGIDPGADAFLQDSDFYASAILAINEDKKTLGIDLCGFDLEIYTAYTWKPHYHSVPDITPLHQLKYAAIAVAGQDAVDEVGQVDYIQPCWYIHPYHHYDALSLLGRKKSITHIMYDNENNRTQAADAVYDTQLAFVNTTKTNSNHPTLQFYLPKEILVNKRELWRNEIILFPLNTNTKAVAEAVRAIFRL